MQLTVTLHRFERRCIIEVNFTNDIVNMKIWLFINVQHENEIANPWQNDFSRLNELLFLILSVIKREMELLSKVTDAWRVENKSY